MAIKTKLKKIIKFCKGFSLIELLIVISIIAILIGIVFIGLDPLTRFKDARNSRRFQDIRAVVQAIQVNQVDNKGIYTTPIIGRSFNANMMIGTGTSGCNSHNGTCAIPVASSGACINLATLASSGHISDIPISPTGSSSNPWSSTYTGYVLTKYNNGTVKIEACESENGPAIIINFS